MSFYFIFTLCSTPNGNDSFFLKFLNSSLCLVVSYIMKPFQISKFKLYKLEEKNVIFLLSDSIFPEDNDQV